MTGAAVIDSEPRRGGMCSIDSIEPLAARRGGWRSLGRSRHLATLASVWALGMTVGPCLQRRAMADVVDHRVLKRYAAAAAPEQLGRWFAGEAGTEIPAAVLTGLATLDRIADERARSIASCRARNRDPRLAAVLGLDGSSARQALRLAVLRNYASAIALADGVAAQRALIIEATYLSRELARIDDEIDDLWQRAAVVFRGTFVESNERRQKRADQIQAARKALRPAYTVLARIGARSKPGVVEDEPRQFFLLRMAEIAVNLLGIDPAFRWQRRRPDDWTRLLEGVLAATAFPGGLQGLDATLRSVADKADATTRPVASGFGSLSRPAAEFGALPSLGLLIDYGVALETPIVNRPQP